MNPENIIDIPYRIWGDTAHRTELCNTCSKLLYFEINGVPMMALAIKIEYHSGAIRSFCIACAADLCAQYPIGATL